MKFKKISTLIIMSAMLMTQVVPAMASEFTDFIMKNQAWSYADMRSNETKAGSVLGLSRVDIPYADCLLLDKSEEVIKVVSNGIVQKIIPATSNMKDGTYTLTEIYPASSAAGVIVFGDNDGNDIGSINGHVSVTDHDSLLLTQLAEIGEKFVIRT